MTRKREKILDICRFEERPMDVLQLCVILKNEGFFMDKATVYRALKYLEEQGKVASFVFNCDKRGVTERYYYSIQARAHRHYMHCVRCHQFTILPDCPLHEGLKTIERETGFHVDQHFLTLKGTCRKCRQKENME